MTAATPGLPDLWHHYGRARAATDRSVPEGFSWTWAQDHGPGPEALDDITGRLVADLGAGAGRHAAHLAARYQPARVDAVDASPAQHAMAASLYAGLAPRLRLVHADAVAHLHANPATYDVLYSLFGAACFTDPRKLLPAAADALRPGGRLVISTLGHYLDGTPAQADAVPSDIPAKTPEGRATVMHRWVLQEHVWTKLLDTAGFTHTTASLLTTTNSGPGTLLLTAIRTAP